MKSTGPLDLNKEETKAPAMAGAYDVFDV